MTLYPPIITGWSPTYASCKNTLYPAAFTLERSLQLYDASSKHHQTDIGRYASAILFLAVREPSSS